MREEGGVDPSALAESGVYGRSVTCLGAQQKAPTVERMRVGPYMAARSGRPWRRAGGACWPGLAWRWRSDGRPCMVRPLGPRSYGLLVARPRVLRNLHGGSSREDRDLTKGTPHWSACREGHWRTRGHGWDETTSSSERATHEGLLHELVGRMGSEGASQLGRACDLLSSYLLRTVRKEGLSPRAVAESLADLGVSAVDGQCLGGPGRSVASPRMQLDVART
ncbi:hypothetical protein Dimus_005515 [Dionaea muscipula]